MDAREARRAAEKAAKEQLQQTLVGVVGDLGVAHAQRVDASTGVTDAAQQGRELVKQAEARAAELTATAKEAVEQAEADYVAAFEGAVTAGWSAGTLAGMGYDRPGKTRRVGSKTASPAPTSTEDAPQLAVA